MNRKITGLIIVIISIFLFLSIIIMSDKEAKYSDLIIDENEWNEIIKTREYTENELINSIKFNGYDLLLDSNNTWFYSLIENSSKAYSPNVSYDSIYRDVKIVINKKITNELIENNEDIEILVYTNDSYHIYNLKCTTLPIMNIIYDETQEVKPDSYIKMKMYLFDNRINISKRVVLSDGKIRLRGASSSLYAKKNYKLSLTQQSLGNHTRENNISLLGMREDEKWILYGAYNDQEKIRNVFASNLWMDSCAYNNSFNINNGYEYRYTELFINNTYSGLYALGFMPDEKMLQLQKDKNGEYIEYIFKKKNWTNSEIEILKKEDKTMEGYEFKFDNNEDIAWNKLKNYYKIMQTSDDISKLYEISDIDNVIDTYLFVTLINSPDIMSGGSLKNMYLTIKNKGNKDMVIYTPWDFDLSFGNGWTDTNINGVIEYGVSYDNIYSLEMLPTYFIKKLNDKNIDIMITNRYNELRNTYWSNDNINKMIDEYESYIYNSGAFLRDKNTWSDGNYNSENIKLNDFRNYVIKRLEFMDEYITSNFNND